jgi:hypothetical protein
MIWINFGTWNNRAGFLFKKQRFYINGYKWTPFIKISIRYKGKTQRWNNLLWGLGLK